MSSSSRLAVVVERLDSFGALASRARRAMLDLNASDGAPLFEFAELLAPQERETASLDALVFQVFVKTRVGMGDVEMATLRESLLDGSASSAVVEQLRSIADTLDRERSAIASRHGEI